MKYKTISVSLLVCLILAATLISCQKVFQTPVMKGVREMRLVSINPDQIVIYLTPVVQNPNSYPITLNNLRFLVLNEKAETIGYSLPLDKVILARHDSTRVDITLHLDTRKFSRLISHTKNTVNFRIRGNCHATALGIGKEISFEKLVQLSLRDYLQKLKQSESIKSL
jgi:LEA14-like dessication related protein